MGLVLVTGAAGFLGGAILLALRRAGHAVRATWHRHEPRVRAADVDWQRDDLCADRDRSAGLLLGVDTVVHLAARVHISGMRRYWSNPFQRANVLATRRLAQQSQSAGVRRFIFMSTIGVHGSENRIERGMPTPMQATDPVRPNSAYARSKLAAEQALSEIRGTGPMQLITLRAPLVFGPGNGGNFLRLLGALDHGLPLPIGSQPAPRSLVYVENLADLLVACVQRPEVAQRTFLLADFDLTVTALAGKLAALLGRRLRSVRLPDWLLIGGALRSLTRPLLVDARPIRAATGWQPAVAPDEALARTLAWYRSAR